MSAYVRVCARACGIFLCSSSSLASVFVLLVLAQVMGKMEEGQVRAYSPPGVEGRVVLTASGDPCSAAEFASTHLLDFPFNDEDLDEARRGYFECLRAIAEPRGIAPVDDVAKARLLLCLCGLRSRCRANSLVLPRSSSGASSTGRTSPGLVVAACRPAWLRASRRCRPSLTSSVPFTFCIVLPAVLSAWCACYRL